MSVIEISAESLSKFPKIERGNLTIWEIFTKEQSPYESVAIIYLEGQAPRVNNASHAHYKVLKGKVCFRVWRGEAPEMRVLLPGQSIDIPPGTPYEDFGLDGWMMAVDHPAFDATRVRILD